MTPAITEVRTLFVVPTYQHNIFIVWALDNASVNSTCAPTPPPQGSHGAFVQVLCPGGGAIVHLGGDPPENLIHEVSKPSIAVIIILRYYCDSDIVKQQLP